MLEFNVALKMVRDSLTPLAIETVSLGDSLNRVVAEDIISDVNLPPFNKAAMDGFACRRIDLPGPFVIVEDIPAGKFPDREINAGQCSRIMTGAPIPEGADLVFMVEHHEIQPDGSVIFTRDNTSDNICYLGEDVKEGDVVLTKGTLIKPQEIAILAGAGKSTFLVFRKPKVGVISTGSELVEPYLEPKPGQIRNSNGYQMMAQLTKIGTNVEYFGIVADTMEDIQGKIQSAIKLIDVLFISGGVSVGDYDFVPQVLQELDFEIIFTSIATKPGKHTLFARKENKYVLGFPGNPVSSFIQLEFIGKELLYGLMGYSPDVLRFKAILIEDYHRKNGDRLEFLPVRMTETGKIQLLDYNGSAHIHALSKANALMEIPIGVKTIEKGDLAHVRPL
ncbi:MAG: molybdopterin molybdotransferase MoeA [Prolixibacteraceae bacterium]